jgi:phage terminase large subunit-like protein
LAKQPTAARTAASQAAAFLRGLILPEGRLAGSKLRLAPYQHQFIEGALADDANIGVLSVGRGNAKTALAAGVALGSLLGKCGDTQRRREILIGARTAEQGRVSWQFVAGFARSLPVSVQKRLTFRRSPRLEIEFDDEHVLRVLPADGKTALGTAPTLVLMDERGHWERDKGDALEHALLSGLGKRGGRALIISTSAPDDSHAFSRWLDEDQPGTYRQEHRPAPALPADDTASLLVANPGAEYGIGASVEWLQAQARRAIARGGSTLTSFRLLNRNERVSGESRDVLLSVDEWLGCETAALPPRQGKVIVGIDLGGSASMSAAAFLWPSTGRLECHGWFPSRPTLCVRGASDGVSGRYIEMEQRGELSTVGDMTVPVASWLAEVMRRVEGETISALVADRYRQSELGEAIDKAGIRCPIIWRGMGFRDGGEDVERFRRAAFDGKVKSAPSLLLRSAFADAVVLRDPANNSKLAKGRSNGRIDAAAATVLAVAEGARQTARPARASRAPTWA